MENISEPRPILSHPVTAIALCAGLAGGIWGSLVCSWFQHRGTHRPPSPVRVVYIPVPLARQPAPPAAPAPAPAPMPPLGPARACSGIRPSYQIDHVMVDRMLRDSSLAAGARFVPSIRDGKPDGFKVYAVRPGSVFAWLGLQNGDLLRSINGLDLSTPDHALGAYATLRQASDFDVNLERHGEKITLAYHVY